MRTLNCVSVLSRLLGAQSPGLASPVVGSGSSRRGRQGSLGNPHPRATLEQVCHLLVGGGGGAPCAYVHCAGQAGITCEQSCSKHRNNRSEPRFSQKSLPPVCGAHCREARAGQWARRMSSSDPGNLNQGRCGFAT